MNPPKCPHCNQTLNMMTLPPEAGYDSAFWHVCFNDECPYYQQGWQRMWDNYRVKCSYRYRVDPTAGAEASMPVWSERAMRDRIIG